MAEGVRGPWSEGRRARGVQQPQASTCVAGKQGLGGGAVASPMTPATAAAPDSAPLLPALLGEAELCPWAGCGRGFGPAVSPVQVVPGPGGVLCPCVCPSVTAVGGACGPHVTGEERPSSEPACPHTHLLACF